MIRACRVAGRLRGDGVVPVAVELVALEVPGFECLHVLVRDPDSLGYRPVSRTAVTFRPVLVVTALMVWMMTSWETSGRPRQFMVIAENSRCSILFHLLVPGGTDLLLSWIDNRTT
jgi:hypothetical protein